MRDGCYLEIQAIGAGAINQSIKAIAIARGFLAPTGIFITCLPAFTEIDINGEKKTGIKLQVEAQELH
nr:MAG TPA: Stage V sporulation protein S (SpoVS) [Caudoviricetes sp.]